MPYQFGKTSTDRLHSCHEDLVKIHQKAIELSPIDYGISEGYRSPERQLQLFTEGKSKIDGVNQLGKHNVMPSMATDIFIYHPDINIRRKLIYHNESLAMVAGVIIASAELLYSKGEIAHKIRWGGNWDKDGVILLDQSFDDLVHFELYAP